jgi:hypothetical protein
LGSLPERFMGKQIVVCYLPVPSLGAKTAVSPVLLPEGKKDLTPRIGPRNGEPLQCFTRIGPPKWTLTSSSHNHLMYQSTACSSTSGSCLLPQSLRPEDRFPVHLSGTAHVGPKAPLSAPATGHRSNHSHPNRRLVIA